MKTLIALITFLILLAGGSQNAHADQLRNCVGPYTLSSQNYAPGVLGIPVKHFDGQMTVHMWKTGADAISVNIEATNYNVIEDPLGGSFINLATRTGSAMDEVVGPFESLRFNVTNCGTDCTTKVKVCGRIAN